MGWPVSRDRYDEAVRIRDSRIKELETELYTLHDRIFMEKFGFQLHGTLPQETPEPEPDLTDAQQAEREYEDARESEVRRLRSIARTSPSRLAPELRRAQAADVLRRATAARPTHVTQAQHPAVALFEQAKKEVAN